MMSKAEVIADSISQEDIRITTVRLTYPKFIHGELMTHRVFSRNAGSSRAIPVKRLLEYVRQEPAEPMHWGLNERGMQANHEATGLRRWVLQQVWKSARRVACRRAWLMDKLGGHKQIVNRLVETHGHINVLVTSTHWANFHALRDHKDAQPEIRALSQAIQQTMYISKPRLVLPGEWHLPYVMDHEARNTFGDTYVMDGQEYDTGEVARMVSAARCARTSYLTMEGRQPTIVEDLKLYHKLAGGIPLHASPLEHIATPDIYHKGRYGWAHKDQWGNFYGWRQYRKLVPGESTRETFEARTRGRQQLVRASSVTTPHEKDATRPVDR